MIKKTLFKKQNQFKLNNIISEYKSEEKDPKNEKTTATVIKLSLKSDQFQTAGILLFEGAQKLYGPEISRFSLWMLKVFDNLRRLFIFSNDIVEIDRFTLDLRVL